MCLIVVKPKRQDIPKREYLWNGFHRNDDGIGIAYHKEGMHQVIIRKDFDGFNTFYEYITKNVKKEDALLIHFRFATSGKKDEGNRHPFPITHNKHLLRRTYLRSRYAVAHNGILSKYSGHAKYSDTQKFIVDILASPPIKDNLGTRSIQRLIKNYLAGDKLAILNAEGTFLLFGEYQKEDGCQYSNEGYKTTWTDYSYGYSNIPKVTEGKADDELYRDYCDACGQNKNVRYSFSDGMWLLLCKRCRKQLRRGTLELIPEKLWDV